MDCAAGEFLSWQIFQMFFHSKTEAVSCFQFLTGSFFINQKFK